MPTDECSALKRNQVPKLDQTQTQSLGDQKIRTSESKLPNQPPVPTPGYQLSSRIGKGAYGEVWRGSDATTNRNVAIKFYAHRQSADLTVVVSEVEKLGLLADNRSIVQILRFEKNGERPYYVMEYFENGSLADWVNKAGCPPVETTVEILQQIAQSLVHAHAKKVIHCDLKPANVLLDQDWRPCLADFGQARLSSDHAPALGTFFYMAPEQADLQANPDPRWDVYGLGAIAYFLLVGQPPQASQELIDTLDSSSGLVERLERYRAALQQAPPASAHRRIRGVDSVLAGIIDRCLECDPARRYPTVKQVVDSLAARGRAKRRNNSLALAVLAPLLLLALTAGIRWYFNFKAIDNVRSEYLQWALKNNSFAADVAAANASTQILRLMDAAKDEAEHPAFLPLFRRAIGPPDPETSDVNLPSAEVQLSGDAREQLVSHLRARFDQLKRHEEPGRGTPHVTKMRVTGPDGVAFAEENGAGPRTHETGYPPDLTIGHPQLLPAFLDDSGPHWLKKISVPIISTVNKKETGAVEFTLNVSELGSFGAADGQLSDQAAVNRSIVVLADAKGKILHHPAFDGPHAAILSNAARRTPFIVPVDQLHDGVIDNFRDPVGENEAAKDYRHRWVAAVRKVNFPEEISANSDDAIYVIVQSDYRAIVQPAGTLWTTFTLNMGVVSLAALLCLAGLVVGLLCFERQPQAYAGR
jgi:serine/threonine protein kinase